MKFNFKMFTEEYYNSLVLYGVAMAFYGAMTALTLLGFVEPITIANCGVYIVIGMGISGFAIIKWGTPNNENI